MLFLIIFLSSCYSNPKDIEKIKDLEIKINDKDKSIDKLKNEIEILKDKNNNDLFLKNIECSKYKELRNNESMIDLFYSSKLNTCIIWKFHSRDFAKYWIENTYIEDSITWTSIKFWSCKSDPECLDKYKENINNIK